MLPLAAAVTLGQAPREDIVDEMRVQVPEFRWIQTGALDEIDEAALARLAPGTDEFPLVTRMRGGRPILIGEQAVRPFVQRAVNRVASDVDLIVVLCSSPLSFQSPIPVLFPDRLLTAAVAAFGYDVRIVVLTPSADQIPLQQVRWRGRGFLPKVLCASPYGGTDFRLIGEAVRHLGASVVVLDCIAYSSEMRAAVAAASGVPTLLVRSLVASVAQQAACPPDGDTQLGHGRESIDSAGARPRSLAAVEGTSSWPTVGAPSAAGRHNQTSGATRLESELRLNYFLGAVHSGDRLPSVRDLARRLHVSPTTAAEWYRALLDQGLISSRLRSGVFVKCPGAGLSLSRRETSVLHVLQRALHHLDLLGHSVREVADLLRPCVDPRSDDVTFGCVLHRELYDVLVPHLHRRLGFHLPTTLLACHEGGYDAVRRQAAADRSLRCLLATFLDSPFVDRLAGDLGLDLIALQLDPRTVNVLRAPNRGKRYIVTRDAAFAVTIRSLVARLQRQPGTPGVVVTSLADPGGLEEADREADEIYISHAAFERAGPRLTASDKQKLFQIRLADQTIEEILFRFLALAGSRTLQSGS